MFLVKGKLVSGSWIICQFAQKPYRYRFPNALRLNLSESQKHQRIVTYLTSTWGLGSAAVGLSRFVAGGLVLAHDLGINGGSGVVGGFNEWSHFKTNRRNRCGDKTEVVDRRVKLFCVSVQAACRDILAAFRG